MLSSFRYVPAFCHLVSPHDRISSILGHVVWYSIDKGSILFVLHPVLISKVLMLESSMRFLKERRNASQKLGSWTSLVAVSKNKT